MKTIARFEGLDDFFHTLAQDLDGELRTDAYSKALYATDASIYQVPPLGVLLPHSPETIEAAVALAAPAVTDAATGAGHYLVMGGAEQAQAEAARIRGSAVALVRVGA